MVDLFSGLGGASEAFVRADWDVLRIDNNPLLSEIPHTIMMDIENITIEDAHRMKVDLLWASPPCTEFSQGYSAPGPTAKREGKAFLPGLGMVKKSMEIIQEVKPRFWVIENVIGSIKHLKKLLGEPRQIIGPYVLWGNFPFIHWSPPPDHKKPDAWSTNPLRANIRAKIPLGLSEGLLQTITAQTTLEVFE